MPALLRAQTVGAHRYPAIFQYRSHSSTSYFRSRPSLTPQRLSSKTCRALPEPTALRMLDKEQSYALLLSTLAGLSTSIGGAAAVSPLLMPASVDLTSDAKITLHHASPSIDHTKAWRWTACLAPRACYWRNVNIVCGGALDQECLGAWSMGHQRSCLWRRTPLLFSATILARL